MVLQQLTFSRHAPSTTKAKSTCEKRLLWACQVLFGVTSSCTCKLFTIHVLDLNARCWDIGTNRCVSSFLVCQSEVLLIDRFNIQHLVKAFENTPPKAFQTVFKIALKRPSKARQKGILKAFTRPGKGLEKAREMLSKGPLKIFQRLLTVLKDAFEMPWKGQKGFQNVFKLSLKGF